VETIRCDMLPKWERSDCHEWQAVHWCTRPNIFSGGCCNQNIKACRSGALVRQTRYTGLFLILYGIVVGMLGRFLVFILVISGISLFTVLAVMTPGEAGAIGILGVFLLAYLFILSLLTFFMFGVSRVVVRFSKTVTVKKPLQPLTLKLAYYYASVVGLAPVILISMQSVGSLGAYEFGLVMLLVVIGCVYVSKRAV